MARLYGELDLTEMGKHKKLIREWTDKNGNVHKTMRVIIGERKTATDRADHYIKLSVPKEQLEAYKDVNLFVGDLKTDTRQQAQPTQQAAPKPAQTSSSSGDSADDLPF